MPRTLFPLTTLASCLSLCLILCPVQRLKADPDPDSTVIAKVGDDEVTAGEVRATIANQDANTQAAIARDPSALSKVVRAILVQRIVYKEAVSKKWDQDPSVAAALEHMRENAIAQTYLQSVSKPPDSYPSDAEVQAAYDANKSKLVVPRSVDLAQIYIKDPKGASADDDAKAQVKVEAVRKALAKKGADFAAIATAESDDAPSAAKGGELGWLAESRIQPEILKQMGSLSKGSTSQAIHLDDGWHFIKVLDSKESHTASLDEIKAQLVQKMRQAKMQQNSQEYVAKEMQDNPVQINELELSKVLK